MCPPGECPGPPSDAEDDRGSGSSPADGPRVMTAVRPRCLDPPSPGGPRRLDAQPEREERADPRSPQSPHAGSAVTREKREFAREGFHGRMMARTFCERT